MYFSLAPRRCQLYPPRMERTLHDQFKEAAQLLHQRNEGEFAYFRERWWLATLTQASEYIWTPTGARTALLARVEELVGVIPDTSANARLLAHLETRWGRNQITGYASKLFERRDGLVIRKAPGLSPEPQAPEAEPQPTQPDH